jgi:hypothetical protein
VLNVVGRATLVFYQKWSGFFCFGNHVSTVVLTGRRAGGARDAFSNSGKETQLIGMRRGGDSPMRAGVDAAFEAWIAALEFLKRPRAAPRKARLFPYLIKATRIT